MELHLSKLIALSLVVAYVAAARSPLLDSFADLTTEEFAQRYLNTSQCGSSWAIATTSVIESAWFESTGNMTQFSVQQVIDCDPSSDGCSRGTESGPYDYIISLTRQGGGFEKEEDYPYTEQDGLCNYSADKAVGKFSNSFYVDFFEERIDSDLVNFGPLSFSMDATTLQFYVSGVLENLNHVMVLIGWGVDANGKYWVAKCISKTPKCEMECGYEDDGCSTYATCGLCDWQHDWKCGPNHTCIKDFFDGPNVFPALDTITITRVAQVVDFKGLLPTMCCVNYSFVPEFGAPWVDFSCPMAGLLGMWNNTYHWFARIPMFEEHNLLEITAWCVYNGQQKHYPGNNDTTRYVRFQYDASASSAAIRAISDDTGTIGVAQGVSASEAAKIAVTVQGDDLSGVQCAVVYSVLDRFGDEWADVHEVGMQGEQESWYLAVEMPAAGHVLEAKVGCQAGTGAKYDSSASSDAIRAISDDTGTIGVVQRASASEAAKIAVTVQGDDLSGVQCAVAYSVLDRFGEEWADVHEVGMQGELESWYLAVAMPAAGHVLEAKVGCQAANGVKVWTTEKYLFQSL
eukprot:m51a1_g9536 hypothetical protein (572) ;mRNA; r:816267-820307